LKIGTGDKATTNWPGTPTQPPSQADQIISNTTDPGRVYYVATDELGNFYVGDYFKVDQATGQATLNSSAFNLSGLETLQLGAIGGLIGASINEFSTDGAMTQNSDSKAPTQAAVRTYVGTINATTPTGGTFAVTGNQTISGNLTVNGTTTTVSTTNTTVSDQLLELGTGRDGAPSGDAGIIIERGDSNNAFIGFDESADKFTLATTTATGASTGDLTLTTGTLLANVEGTLTGNASTASNLSGTPNISVGTIASGNLTVTGGITATTTVGDALGTDVRKLASRGVNSAYTLVLADAGRFIDASSNPTITIPAGVFSAGHMVTILNNSGSNMAVNQGGSMSVYNGSDGTTGNLTMGARSTATILFQGANNCYISGSKLS